MKFQKLISILLLIIVILLSSLVIYVKVAANGSEDNYFNQNLRYKITRHRFIRNFLRMHFDGDAKSDYLGEKPEKILVEIIPMQDMSLNQEIAELLSERIHNITGKKTDYIYSINKIPYSPASTLGDLEKQLMDKKTYFSSSVKSVIYLIIANQEAENNQIGSTLQEDGIVLFEKNLEMIKNNEDAYNKYAVSVLLHEFGHQIGLQHNDFTNCIMNEAVELSNYPKLSKIIDNFCEEEKKQITEMKL